MTNNEFKVLLGVQYAELLKMTATKGREYTNDNTDQLINFKEQAAELGMRPEQVLMVYLNKHLSAIKSYVRTGQVHSEPIEGRITDAILYLVLLRGLITDGRPMDGTQILAAWDTLRMNEGDVHTAMARALGLGSVDELRTTEGVKNAKPR